MVRRFKFGGRQRTVAGIAASLYSSFKSKKRAQNKSYPGKSPASSYRKSTKTRRKSGSYTTTQKKKKKIIFTGAAGFSKSSRFTRTTGRVTKDILKQPQTKYKVIATGGNVAGNASQGVFSFRFGAQPDTALLFNNAAVDTGQAVNTTSFTKHLYIGSIMIKTLFTNQCLDTCKLRIYDLVCKQSQVLGSYVTPEQQWANGVGAQQGPNTNSQFFPGDTPSQYKTFNQYWWIVGYQDVVMQPGSNHEHIWIKKVNKVYDYQNIQLNTAQRGLTMATMFVHHGMPHDDTTANSVGSKIAFSAPKIIFASSLQLSGCIVSNSSSQEYQVNGLSATATHLYGVKFSEETQDYLTAAGTTVVTKNIIAGLGD